MYFPKTGLFLCQTYPPLFHKQRHWVLTDTPSCMSKTYNTPFFAIPFLVLLSFCIIFSVLSCLSNPTGYKIPLQYYATWMLFHQCIPHWLIPLLVLLSNPHFGIILSPLIWFHSTDIHWTHIVITHNDKKNFSKLSNHMHLRSVYCEYGKCVI